MEDFEKQIQTEINTVKKALNHTKELQLIEDLSDLNFLCYLLELSFYKRNHFEEFKLSLTPNIFSYYLNYIKEYNLNSPIIQNYINFMLDLFSEEKNDINYKYTSKILLDDSIDLVFDFFKSYDIKYYNTFKNIKKNLLVLDKEALKEEFFYGTALCGNSTLTSPRIVLADASNLLTPITLVHEASHVYDFSINRNLTSKQYSKKLLSISSEINPYHTELHFMDFLSQYYKNDIEIAKKDFDDYFYSSIVATQESFEYIEKSFFKYNKVYNDFIDQIRDFYGRLIAYILYSLNDIDKELYIRDKIMTDIHNTSLKDILLNEGINLEEYSTHEKVFKLIKKHWN